MRLAPSLVGLALALAAGATARAETDVPPPKPWLGIGFATDNYGLAYVTDVHPGTGAAAAGILPEDTIVAIDNIELSPVVGLSQLVTERKVGQRITVTIIRRTPDGVTLPLRLTPRLSAKPTTDEMVYRRLNDHALPALTVFDRHGTAVPIADWTRRPQVWMVFDARCDACGGAASTLRARLSESDDGAADVPLRTVVLGQHVELGAFMARVPLMGTVWRIDRGEEDRRNVLRFFLSGIEEPASDGVVLVVDHRGIVRFATAISAGESAHDGACAAAARAVRAWRP